MDNPPPNLESMSSMSFKNISLQKLAKVVRRGKAKLFDVRIQPQPRGMKVSDMVEKLVAEYEDLFVEKLLNRLPRERDLDFQIKLKSDEPPPVHQLIPLSFAELKELKHQIQDVLQKRFIRPSSSPYGAPILFVKKES